MTKPKPKPKKGMHKIEVPGGTLSVPKGAEAKTPSEAARDAEKDKD